MQDRVTGSARRVVLVYWKYKKERTFEVFSNLKNFCSHYPAYSYNTLNNYLSKQKKAYENEEVLVERKKIIGAPAHEFKLEPVVRRARLNEIDEVKEDVAYWLSRPAKERIAAVTFLVRQSLRKGEVMDKSVVSKRKLKQQ